MSFFKKRRLAIATFVYWVLLLYIIVALLFWYVELENQNLKMLNYKVEALNKSDASYSVSLSTIQKEKQRKSAQYLGEGSFFLLLILFGAIFVYRAVRRQLILQRQEQNFMMAVTHELKTPIAVAKLNLETLLKHQLDPAKQNRLLQSSLQEMARLNTLSANILIASQLEGGGYHLTYEELDFSKLSESVATDFAGRFADRHWEIFTDPEIVVKGDTLLLQMLISNLIENAIKYSPKTGTITITVTTKTNKAVLTVSDQGNGIPDIEKKKVFSKFYRTGNEQTRSAQGTGLGLYLCKRIAADHKAQIEIHDNFPAGSIFTVTFQRAGNV